MSDVTQILSQIEQGDPSAAEQLLPLVYDELRKLAAAKMADEKRGQTLQATALVHDAYIRLVNVKEVLQQISGMTAGSMVRPGQDVRITVQGQTLQLPSRAATAINSRSPARSPSSIGARISGSAAVT